MVLTVTWLSVQTPTTYITGVTIVIVISILGRINLTWAPMALKSVSLSLKDFHSSASSSVSLSSNTGPIHNQRTYLLTQPVVHEDEDGELAGKLLRGDVDELEALPRLVDADHGEGAESLHHGGALAWDLNNQHTWCQNFKR